MTNSELSIGVKGETFFKEKLAYPLFFDEMAMRDINLTGKRFLDNITKQNKEGDFRLIDGTIIEVKTLVGPYNNVLIEYARGETVDRSGWYQHCKTNGIEYIIWNRYRSRDDDHPVYSVLVNFLVLSEYIDRQVEDLKWYTSHTMRPVLQTDSNGNKDVFHNLCISCQELFYCDCGAEKIAYPDPLEAKISDVLARKELPPWQGLRIQSIIRPWN